MVNDQTGKLNGSNELFRHLARSFRRGDISSFDAIYHKFIRSPDSLNKFHSRAASKLSQRNGDRWAEKYLKSAIPHEYRALHPSAHPSPTALADACLRKFPFHLDDEGCEVPDFRGAILLYGPKGSGKTNAAFTMLGRWVRTEYVRFQWHCLNDLLLLLGGDSHCPHRLSRAVGAEHEVLFIDDLQDVRLQPWKASLLRELFDEVVSRKKPVILASTLRGEELVKHWCELAPETTDIANAVIGRIRAYSNVIQFKGS